MNRAARYSLVGGLGVAWVIVVLYRDPRRLVDSLRRLRHPPVDGQAVAEVAAALPDDYETIERFVSEYVPHKPAWAVYGVPWYFPTVTEVLSDRAGDCQARAILVASILAAKGMPFTMRYSFSHVWVDYPGKKVTEGEDPATSFVSDRGTGWAAALPRKIPLRHIVKARVAYHWTPMPRRQKIMLGAGVALAGLLLLNSGHGKHHGI
jgi:hypothetical protein